VDAFGNTVPGTAVAYAERLSTLSRESTDADASLDRAHLHLDPSERAPPRTTAGRNPAAPRRPPQGPGPLRPVEKARGEDRKAELAQEICTELKVHAQIEEEIFYPAAREALKEQDLIDEATVEHASAKDLIAQIEQAQAGDELFDAKVIVLGEYIKHHVKEEHNEIFPKLKKTKLDLKGLGQQLAARKETLMAEG
jgi:hypothetical protein